MSVRVRQAFQKAQEQGRPAFVPYITAGHPHPDSTVDILLTLQKCGADVIELGIPFTDPLADGPTIAEAHFTALKYGVDIDACFNMVKQAREKGLQVPVIFMGYYNPLLQYGEEKICQACSDCGGDGFLVVDLPPEEATTFLTHLNKFGLCYIPLITPTTTVTRMKILSEIGDGFIYVVSRAGVTGTSEQVNSQLPNLLNKIRSVKSGNRDYKLPLAVGFGVSNNEQFLQVGGVAEGVIVGSGIIKVLGSGKAHDEIIKDLEKYVTDLCKPSEKGTQQVTNQASQPESKELPTDYDAVHSADTSASMRFGDYGGQYAPEALVGCLNQLELAYQSARKDPTFWAEFESFYPFINRPSSLHRANRLTEHCGGASIWLKREDLNHTGAHKINNALGQILLAKRLGKKRIIAETGAGQHGVATATVCAHFGLECVIYMGAEDCRRQALNVFRIKLLGAQVVPVKSGSMTLKDAVNEAMRDWVTNVESTHYLVGSAIGPHPFPTLVRDFQAVIGNETRQQLNDQIGKLPDAVVACVGGGSNAIGMFHAFVPHPSVQLVGVEAAGDGVDTPNHSATMSRGTPGVFHGARTYLLQDENGQITPTHSISAGLDYPGVGPEHCFLNDTKRATYMAVNDVQALIGFKALAQLEGILPALETSHAVYQAMELAKQLGKDKDVVICVSGRGDKDVQSVANALPRLGDQADWDLRFDDFN